MYKIFFQYFNLPGELCVCLSKILSQRLFQLRQKSAAIMAICIEFLAFNQAIGGGV